MKTLMFAAAFALVLSAPGFAQADPQGTGDGVTAPPITGTTGQEDQYKDPGSDVHTDNKTDYRLSCPHISHDPTVNNCRGLETRKDPG